MKPNNILRVIYFLAAIGFYNCGGEKNDVLFKDKTVLFRSSEYNLVFCLTINNDFNYCDSLINKDVVLGFPIGSYKKQKGNSVIHLRINDKDTIFEYPLFKVDSILFGLNGGGNFYIISNHDKNAWVTE